MAFNPFHHFRRYSKVVFAGLAILCMLTFVLSSGMGRGDLLSRFTDWAGGGRRSEAVLTLYGKKYDTRQVLATNLGRQLASEYMTTATALAQQNLANRVMEGAGKLDGPWKPVAERLLQQRFMMQFGPQFADDYRR